MCEDVWYLDDEEVAKQGGHGEGDNKLSSSRLGNGVSSGLTALRTNIAHIPLCRCRRRTVELYVARICCSSKQHRLVQATV